MLNHDDHQTLSPLELQRQSRVLALPRCGHCGSTGAHHEECPAVWALKESVVKHPERPE